ncbi:MAG: thioredoxin [Chloroflexi bacterium]|nr:thioredoxin [Chloroflexota bacterium]MBI2975471.1 thioredoxin [Chloroflexota bacterium]MBI4316525.1 thioredoxin [Chloroflexota bacterium]MBI5291696.1 thioredoxin [Chloroflexota bacterium]
MSVINLSDATFKAEALDADAPVLVDFTAEWCGPCRQLAPIVDQLASEYAGRMSVGRLDIDANIEITTRYGVMGVPTLILFKGGQPVERWMGFVPKQRIVDKLKKHLSAAN